MRVNSYGTPTIKLEGAGISNGEQGTEVPTSNYKVYASILPTKDERCYDDQVAVQ